jgi:hypothetical protein
MQFGIAGGMLLLTRKQRPQEKPMANRISDGLAQLARPLNKKSRGA